MKAGCAGNERVRNFFSPLPCPMLLPTLYRFSRRLILAGLGGWALAGAGTRAAAESATAEIVEVKKIWDAGGHNAFTDLIRWRERWWCTFREAAAHVGGDGVIRVITSTDGATWESAAALTEPDVDLRDPKLSVTPAGRLMVVCGGSIYRGTKVLKGRRPRVSFSDDGRTWTAPRTILEEGDWLWRVTWHAGEAYGVSYRPIQTAAGAGPADGDGVLVLCKSRDGLAWSELAKLVVPDRPNETTLRFLPDGRMIAMVRREAGNTLGWFGEARAPYTQWTWRESNVRFGGPDFIVLPDGRQIAGTRGYVPAVAGAKAKATTVVARIDGVRLETLVTLPSGGDTSYSAFGWHEGLLWVSYYSSHEGKTAIYLAKVRLPERGASAAAGR